MKLAVTVVSQMVERVVASSFVEVQVSYSVAINNQPHQKVRQG